MTSQVLRRLMVVDDDPDVLVILRVALERIGGFDVQCHDDPVEALEQIDACKPQLLILDVMMPGLDGPTLLRELRRRGNTVPTVFLTAKGDQAQEHLRLTDALAVMAKPFQPSQLANQLREIWAASQASGQADSGGDSDRR